MNQVVPTPEEEALARMPQGEQEFLRSLFEFTRSAQQNPDRRIALAARRWERSLRFRVAVTRQQQQRREAVCRTPLATRQPSLN